MEAPPRPGDRDGRPGCEEDQRCAPSCVIGGTLVADSLDRPTNQKKNHIRTDRLSIQVCVCVCSCMVVGVVGGGCMGTCACERELTNTVRDVLGRGPDDDHEARAEGERPHGPEPVEAGEHVAEAAADAPALHEALAVGPLAVAVDGDDVLDEGEDEGRGGLAGRDGADAGRGGHPAAGHPAHDQALQADLDEEERHGDGEHAHERLVRDRAPDQDRRHHAVDHPQALVREVEPPPPRPQRPVRVRLQDQPPRPQRELEPRDEPEQGRDDGED